MCVSGKHDSWGRAWSDFPVYAARSRRSQVFPPSWTDECQSRPLPHPLRAPPLYRSEMQCEWMLVEPPRGVRGALSADTPPPGTWPLTPAAHGCSRTPLLHRAQPVPTRWEHVGGGASHPSPLPRARARPLSDSQIDGNWERDRVGERDRHWERETDTEKQIIHLSLLSCSVHCSLSLEL